MAVNGRNQSKKHIKNLGNHAQGKNLLLESSDKTKSHQQELNMMSDSIENEKEDSGTKNLNVR